MEYAIELLQEQHRLLQDDLKSMLLIDDEFKLTTKRLSDVIDALNKLSAKPMNYDNWVKECKSLLAIKPHVKIRWKDSDFKKCFMEGLTPNKAVQLCWLASY